MNYALDTYDLLNDRLDYVERNWLRKRFANTTKDQIHYLNGAFCYLLGRYFFDEPVDKEITQFVHDDILGNFQAKALSEKAVNLKFRYESQDFLKGDSELLHYLKFLAETEDYVYDGIKDIMGRIVLAYIEELIEIIKEDDKDFAPLRISEIIFLNITSAMQHQFLSKFGLSFKANPSYPYFEGVNQAYERIATSIVE